MLQFRLLIDLLDMNSCPRKQFMTTAKLKDCFDIIMLQKTKEFEETGSRNDFNHFTFLFLMSSKSHT